MNLIMLHTRMMDETFMNLLNKQYINTAIKFMVQKSHLECYLIVTSALGITFFRRT